jgi:prevent-host-death family protein
MFVLDGNRKGAIAEAEIYAAAVRLGLPVLTPISEHGRYDTAFEIGQRLLRVQCKWGTLSTDGSVVTVHIGGSRATPRGHIHTTYSEDEVDLFGIYCGGLDRCFLLPSSTAAGMRALRLRLQPARNSQRACINMAEHLDFEGAVAQLGERVTGSHEVRGSSPLSSTPSTPAVPTTVGVNPFRDKLGQWIDRVAAGEEVIVTRHGRPRIRLSPANGS